MKNENTLMNKENSNNRILKATNNIDFELLTFGLMTFIPCIQLNCNDNNNINFDYLNELIRYCDKQAIEWKIPTHQSKWSNSNIDKDIEYPCLNDEIEKDITQQGAYIDIKEGAVNSLILRTPFENIMKA
ncbi:hypothetical protein RFI_31607 [Reticulomyxa filosa]|uniref:Uncharacterized protein n=1 Tax=Reticulomyxa filosa TaxID=46433 RepID=X6LVZ0_RETFI|nr:hypothetical protein RFI_31607 [Reticulomyxa filosa]|eukprot:ETO05789.1 hypothetical protein RFI_31607 [Reticulomyxa filosa]